MPPDIIKNPDPGVSKALPHENVIKKCWKPDCRKVATCRDGSGWEWCDDHVDQEKTGSVLHTAQEYYDVDFYKERVREAIANLGRELEARCEGKKGYLAHRYKAVGREGRFIDAEKLKTIIRSITGISPTR